MLKELAVAQAHEDGVMCLGLVQRGDEARIVSGGCDGVLKVWTTAGEEVAQAQGHGAGDPVNCIVPLSDRFILTCGDDSRIRCWELGDDYSLTKAEEVRQRTAVNKLLLTDREGGIVAACDDGGEVYIWRIPQKYFDPAAAAPADAAIEKVLSFNGGAESLNCMAAIEGLMWTGGDDGYLRRWHLSKELQRVAGGEAGGEGTQVLPSLNALVVSTEEQIMVNVLTVQGGTLWCGIGAPGQGVVQKRDAVIGNLLMSFATDDWVRALHFPLPDLAYSVYDDGKLVAFRAEPLPITPVSKLDDGDDEDEEDNASADIPDMMLLSSLGNIAIMDMLIHNDLVVVTKESELVLFDKSGVEGHTPPQES